MPENKYKSAIDKVKFDKNLDEKVSNYLSDKTSKEEESNKKGKFKKKVLIPVFTVIACALVLIIAVPKQKNSSDFMLPNSTGNVSVSYVDKFPSVSKLSDLVWLTEDEIINEEETDVFKGQIKNIKNIEMDFDGMTEYRSIAKIKVDKVYRGEVREGDTVSILLPCPINTDVWVEDTGVVSAMREGLTGIFMPIKYNEDSYIEMNKAKIHLKDLTEYGFFDGERYAFIEASDELIFARWAFESIKDANSLEEIEQYILKTIR